MATDRRASPSSLLILLLSLLIGDAAALASRRRWPFQRCFSSHRCCFFPIWGWLLRLLIKVYANNVNSGSVNLSGCTLTLRLEVRQSGGRMEDWRFRGRNRPATTPSGYSL